MVPCHVVPPYYQREVTVFLAHPAMRAMQQSAMTATHNSVVCIASCAGITPAPRGGRRRSGTTRSTRRHGQHWYTMLDTNLLVDMDITSKEALTKVLEALCTEDRATVEQNIAAGPGTEARPSPSTLL